ncbi:MAG: hypothetical protein QG626_261 [Patescibacteria group bacterium]|nr:hypothetical protein [Patescibacteria group bacterium]
MNKLLKQLKQLKRAERLTAMDGQSMAQSWNRIAEAIGADETSEVTPSVSAMYFEYARWNASKYFSKPVAASAFSVMMVASGWIATVNAADSLPGDTLYSVKMITEKTQLRLASLDRKAVLHTEFAGRRLQEASDLQEGTQDADSAQLVHGAIEAYKQEVASAGESLRQLKDEGSAEALATATSVQQNLQAIDTTIDAVAAESGSAEATQEVLAAKEVAKEVNDVATTVAVEVHEEQPTDLSTQELKQMFKSDLGRIEARQRFDLERIDVIKIALADDGVSYDGFAVPTSDELLAYEYPIVAVDSLLSQAMNNFAAGGFRSAFEKLQEIDTALLEIESQLAQVEIAIMQARLQPEPTPVVPEESVTSESVL